MCVCVCVCVCDIKKPTEVGGLDLPPLWEVQSFIYLFVPNGQHAVPSCRSHVHVQLYPGPVNTW